MDELALRQVALDAALETDFHLDVNNLLTNANKILDFLAGTGEEVNQEVKVTINAFDHEPFDFEKAFELFRYVIK